MKYLILLFYFRGLQIVSVIDEIINIFSFVNHMVPVVTIQLCGNVKAVSDRQCVNKWHD